MNRGRSLTAAVLVLLAAATGAQARPEQAAARTEVVVRLTSAPLAQAVGSRAAAAARLAAEQDRFARALRERIPSARVHWRYRLVLNGLAVVLPAAEVPRLRGLPGVRDVNAGALYGTARDSRSSAGAGPAWVPGLPNQGAGMKIAIIDDGVDQTHPYFDPRSYTMPEGFPKGQKAYTTAKVIVARAFPPPGSTWKDASKPFDPKESGHATHVAGIAAGNAGTALPGGRTLSGVAPQAYIGNYKALTVPTDAGVGLDGNAAEIVAAIESAVADGMDVINLSIGEPEVEPTRDLVALALDAAADAGVVPVVAAGNDFGEFGDGSLASPGSSAKAITVAAVASGGDETSAGTIAGFSAAGPTPLSLRLKPDVSAPGVSILSSVPGGKWESMSGTSMASPHVAGAAALLLERHPSWTVAQVKAALVSTGDAADVTPGIQAPPTRGGGGVIDLPQADAPLVLATPSSVSFGLLGPAAVAPASVALDDAGGGSGTWSVAVSTLAAPAGAGLSAPPTIEVPGTITLTPTVSADAPDGEVTGFVVLSRGPAVRRIPFWYRVTHPALAAATATPLRATGSYRGNTRGRPSLVSVYRYPEVPAGGQLTAVLAGPEQLFRVALTRPVANFGVVVTGRAAGVKVEPRVVASSDENRLTGYAALPINLNPYLAQFGDRVLAAGAVRPLAGIYDVVFDSPSASGAGSFSFRFWLDDTAPPRARLESATVRRGAPLRVTVSDAASGVDPSTLAVRVDGHLATTRLRGGVVRIGTDLLRPGRHRLRLQVSDYQESRNMENVPPILPNTRVLTTTFVVRR